jgi:hypothetical protein
MLDMIEHPQLRAVTDAHQAEQASEKHTVGNFAIVVASLS